MKQVTSIALALVLAASGAAIAPVLAPRAVAAAETPPPAPPAAIAPLIGEYGAGEKMVIVFEREGALHLDGQGHSAARLEPAAGGWKLESRTLTFSGRRNGQAQVLSGLGEPLIRRDRGAEVEARIRAGVKADPDRLRQRALAAKPPVETGKRPSDLVDLTGIPGLKFDIRYAGTNNFMGIRLYEKPGAYLQRPAAEALARVQKAIAAKGYGLMIHDGYRPWFVTWMFWEAVPPEHHNFVANPANGSRHNRGCAVDLTLYELKTGKVVEMPGRYDEISGRSKPDYVGGASRQRWHRDLLRREMEKEGFTVYPDEWWHFDYQAWREYPIGNATFTELAKER